MRRRVKSARGESRPRELRGPMEEIEDNDHLSWEERHEQEQRAVREAGGGEAEGFELAEEELIEHASHGDPSPDPSHLAGEPEDFEGSEYGEADHEHSAEYDERDDTSEDDES